MGGRIEERRVRKREEEIKFSNTSYVDPTGNFETYDVMNKNKVTLELHAGVEAHSLFPSN